MDRPGCALELVVSFESPAHLDSFLLSLSSQKERVKLSDKTLRTYNQYSEMENIMNNTSKDKDTSLGLRIGLALSGGGFRASIFHLGVIRRLEELGIMKYVHTISAVSGGSIIAAYYVIEMEKRLRQRRAELRGNPERIDEVRLQIFEEIADCFSQALDHNLRSRALVFGPFYHPVLFIKSWWPTLSRSDIMQKEYDKWFYRDETLDHLPAVALPNDKTSSEVDNISLGLTGPTVVLNTTSLLTGERKGFKRESASGIHELSCVNRNILKLSRVVGASSGVPGLFPPTTISGDKLVDGGIADNQGIDALVSPDRLMDGDEGVATDRDDFDVLLVSDASGQMELVHRLGDRAYTVMGRTFSIFQFQLRSKLLKILLSWQGASDGREFAFVHLFLNLKDRPNTARVPSEYIPALGRIRTDLDQFSFIEREALMYHGYTLIDAQIQKHCGKLKASLSGNGAKLEQPPLFLDRPDSDQAAEQCVGETKLRKRVKDVLTAGSGSAFLLRSRRKYPKKSCLVFGLALVAIVVWVRAVLRYLDLLHAFTTLQIERWLSFVIPDWVGWVLEKLFGSNISSLSLDIQELTAAVWIALWVYFVVWLAYVAMRRLVRRWDRKDYQSLTGKEPTVHWAPQETPESKHRT